MAEKEKDCLHYTFFPLLSPFSFSTFILKTYDRLIPPLLFSLNISTEKSGYSEKGGPFRNDTGRPKSKPKI